MCLRERSCAMREILMGTRRLFSTFWKSVYMFFPAAKQSRAAGGDVYICVRLAAIWLQKYTARRGGRTVLCCAIGLITRLCKIRSGAATETGKIRVVLLRHCVVPPTLVLTCPCVCVCVDCQYWIDCIRRTCVLEQHKGVMLSVLRVIGLHLLPSTV